MPGKSKKIHSHGLAQALAQESLKFKECYLWLEQSMPKVFLEETSDEDLFLIVHNLVDFHLQDFFVTIQFKRAAVVMCLDGADADLRILGQFANYGIKNYRTYVSTTPPPLAGVTKNLRVGVLYFSQAVETADRQLSTESKEALRALIQQRDPAMSDSQFATLVQGLDMRFLNALPTEHLILALDMFFRAKTRDNCQYEVRYNEDWRENDRPSLQIVFAWRNTPKQGFLWRIAHIVYRYGLVMKSVNAVYIDPYSKGSILVMSLGLHGANGEAVWDVAPVVDFLRELVTLKYFEEFDAIGSQLVRKGIVNGSMGNLLRCMVNFIHQSLVLIDPHFYRIENIEEAFCRLPELTVRICHLFQLRFDPDQCDVKQYENEKEQLLSVIQKLDTGHEENDLRRRNVLLQAVYFIHYTLKTNYYRRNYSSLTFRLDPRYLDEIPFDRSSKLPDLPYGIFFIRGMHYFAFHIRFRDLARGGLRTVYPEQTERMIVERNNVFQECYNLAYTQHKKNKDIPEGGSKAVIFLEPSSQLETETEILRRELIASGVAEEEVEAKTRQFREEEKAEYLHHAQRSFIEGLLTLINTHADGILKAKYVIDYWKRPEYIYLGPDERMGDDIIEWTAEYARRSGYIPGTAFITSKPRIGINHKRYGVTSKGVIVYAQQLLQFLGIDPFKQPFTLKMSGGPDGDVAGNLIVNLYQLHPLTTKLVALTDISGTIHDPKGLDLEVLVDLFEQEKAIRYYPPELLHEGGFLVDKETRKEESALIQKTLCWRKKGEVLVEDWLSSSDMNALVRYNVHRTKSDLFIPAGGRPRTLNARNYTDFLDETGKPTARAIVEGANLYLTPEARTALEKLGVLIIKDSSANKGGVICSSFEVLCSLTLEDETFLEHKSQLVEEILDRINRCASKESQLLLQTYQDTGMPLTEISDRISERIHCFTDQLLHYLDLSMVSNDPKDPLTRSFLNYCLATLRKQYTEKLLEKIPDYHKKAIIACHLSAQLVYKRGISWSPSVVDILPSLLQDIDIIG